ncbi:putative inhibitor of apoptosis [Eurytemora carolleeae]|uniref:putative inhibitor of apoptosis n=1 Tax=Eurytemora carolleeae TaxID=1294199 RepID=UPI000C760251|nr:putative inhibitor of apoptosis [Eurytemora carolleeae]|eukprot:XP_023348554.1 putative inhibitor of apoptosis [Eurytemora affinis]
MPTQCKNNRYNLNMEVLPFLPVAHLRNTGEHKNDERVISNESQFNSDLNSTSDSQDNESGSYSQLPEYQIETNNSQPDVGEDETDNPRDAQGGEDVVGSRLQDYVDMPPQSPIQHSRTQNDRTLPKYDGPVHNHLASYPARFNTFNDWPIGLNQKPGAMAKAGFFYTGFSDKVTCFYCNGGLCGWEPQDDPMEEHIKSFPDCQFIELTKKENVSMYKKERQQLEIKQEIEQEKTVSDKTRNVSESSDDLENSALICKVCLDKQVSILLLPCRHLVSCGECTVSLQNCPVCRGRIQHTVKAFLI